MNSTPASLSLSVERIPVGAIDTICYVVSNVSGSAVIIDPGAEPEKILLRLQEKSRKPVAILLTHGHYDHIEGVALIKDTFSIPVMGSNDDAFLLESGLQSVFSGRPITPVTLDISLTDGQELLLIGTRWVVIATPGHSPGSLTFLTGSWAFTGDTLFADGGIGRTDLWGGSLKALKASLEKKLFCLPSATIVYPGHGNHSTIGQEKRFHRQ